MHRLYSSWQVAHNGVSCMPITVASAVLLGRLQKLMQDWKSNCAMPLHASTRARKGFCSLSPSLLRDIKIVLNFHCGAFTYPLFFSFLPFISDFDPNRGCQVLNYADPVPALMSQESLAFHLSSSESFFLIDTSYVSIMDSLGFFLSSNFPNASNLR